MGRTRRAVGAAGRRASSVRGRTRRAAPTSRTPARHVVVATGTASGQEPRLPRCRCCPRASDGADAPSGRGATALYLSPTKALAADQLARHRGARRARRAGRHLRRRHPDRRAALDPRPRQRRAHQPRPRCTTRCCPATSAGRGSCGRSSYVVVDECHVYRGVFGVARGRRAAPAAAGRGALRRLADVRPRVGDREPTRPTHASRLIGMPVAAVTDDGSPRGAMTFALWEPAAARRRRRAAGSATTEAAEMLAELVLDGVQTVAFARSPRRGRGRSRRAPGGGSSADDPARAAGVAAYRGGYLPEERRELERGLRDGALRGLAATNALELGVDVSGLDAVRAGRLARARWRRPVAAGRAAPGARGEPSLAVLVAADDPLDTYLVHHPEAIFGAPGRGDRHRPAQPARAGAAPRGRRGGAAAGRGRPARCSAPDARRLLDALVARGHPAPAAGGVVLGARRPARRAHLAARGQRRRRASSRRAPVACSAPSTRRPRTRRCTPAPSTCTRATPGSSPSSTSRRAPRTWCAATRAGRRTRSR